MQGGRGRSDLGVAGAECRLPVLVSLWAQSWLAPTALLTTWEKPVCTFEGLDSGCCSKSRVGQRVPLSWVPETQARVGGRGVSADLWQPRPGPPTCCESRGGPQPWRAPCNGRFSVAELAPGKRGRPGAGDAPVTVTQLCQGGRLEEPSRPFLCRPWTLGGAGLGGVCEGKSGGPQSVFRWNSSPLGSWAGQVEGGDPEPLELPS